MNRVFRTRSFTRWMRKAGLTDEVLCVAVSEMAQGLIDADLGGHLVKKRLALPGQGKRGGARTIVATKMADRWFFVLGFAKNERANIDAAELKALQELAKHYLGFDDLQIEQAIDSGVLTEVRHDDEKA
ncbi:type II toxin-antitoxin system RelE/ParE family toxin [Calidifontimicrobium sp. SYSU G02091]|uniref:type II toxin-antitoxin system RelE/ParE family toxin n=1 Tax=Calidifontimicrobium sp. SYSU G02091 TaxID=2926421 RepID=UPI001F53697E|nr:type II toxin-antitoxin system RelE/ParE family toxin [Calidifontimicrobium sp. SYSU G02091]MCI1193613.1 type II toxin-antitoxin system RelE/ParE family toxin [Calidifontimicrobium sp. SYSU G02091]